MTKFETKSDPSLPPGVDEDISRSQEFEIVMDEENGHRIVGDEEEGRHECVETDISSIESENDNKREKTQDEKTLPRGRSEENASIAVAVAAAVTAALSATEKADAANESISNIRQNKLSLSPSQKRNHRSNAKTKRPDPVETSFQDEYTSQRQMLSPPKVKQMQSLPESQQMQSPPKAQQVERPQPTTPETVASTPPTSPDKSNKNNKNNIPAPAAVPPAATIVIENRSGKKSKSAVLAFAMRHKKKLLFLMVLWILVATGAAAYMFPDFLSIPGLNTQIKELEKQVDRLERSVDEFAAENDRLENSVVLLTDQVDELEKQVDRLESEVNRLSAEVDRLQGNVDTLDGTITRLEDTNDGLKENLGDLEAANSLFQDQNGQLNLSNEEYKKLNQQLMVSNANYKENNDRLNVSVTELKGQVSVLEFIEQNLTDTINEYGQRNQELSDEVDNLSNIRSDLNDQIDDLDEQVLLLTEQNANYSKLNDDLGTIVSFLNNTSLGFQQTYEALTSSLATQITTRRNLLVQDTKLKYQAIVLHWDCDINSRFRLRDFVKNDTEPLGSKNYEDVMEYLEEEALGEVCIDRQDLESFFLSDVVEPNEDLSSMSLADVKAGVSEYTTLAFDYYFPDGGEVGGLSEDDWGEASYACKNLPTEKRFTVSNS